MNNQHYPGFPVPSFIDAPDGKIAVYQAGDIASSKMPIVLVHGWPEIAYCWKNQIDVLAQQGHYVIAPNRQFFVGMIGAALLCGQWHYYTQSGSPV